MSKKVIYKQNYLVVYCFLGDSSWVVGNINIKTQHNIRMQDVKKIRKTIKKNLKITPSSEILMLNIIRL